MKRPIQDAPIDDLVLVSPPHSRLPRLDLGIDWTPAWEEFGSSLSDAFTGPRPADHEPVSGGDDLRVEWVGAYRPGTSLLASLVLEIVVLWVLTLPVWGFLAAPTVSMAPIELGLTSYAPADLREITLAPRKPKAAREAANPKHAPEARLGTDGLARRQTILSLPVKMTHPRQTLIQPKAPSEAPKIVEPMPNLVEWFTPQIAKPSIEYQTSNSRPQFAGAERRHTAAPEVQEALPSAAALNLAPETDISVRPPAPMVSDAPVTPRARTGHNEVSAPQLARRTAAPVNLAPTNLPQIAPPAPVPSTAKVQPRLRANGRVSDAPQIASETSATAGVLTASSAPVHLAPPAPIPSRAGISSTRVTARPARAAPEIAPSGPTAGGNPSDWRRLVALSATPAPPKPEVRVPSGNLAAEVTASPDDNRRGTPGGVHTGGAGANPALAGNNADPVPAAISVSTDHAKVADRPGLADGASRPTVNLKPAAPAGAQPPVAPPRTGPANVAGLLPGAAPEKLLTGDVFTLRVSTPNMTSTRGSWVLSFAQLGVDRRAEPKGQLAGPLPIHTVDPKYPPDTMNEHVGGEVVLYAIIRKDGSIDSIQLVRSLDPRLDKAAMDALAQWRFRPGARSGEPVDIETVIHVPFEYRHLAY